jgi:hypothetical protein
MSHWFNLISLPEPVNRPTGNHSSGSRNSPPANSRETAVAVFDPKAIAPFRAYEAAV